MLLPDELRLTLVQPVLNIARNEYSSELKASNKPVAVVVEFFTFTDR